MAEKDQVFSRLKANLMDDKMVNSESLSRLLGSEIVSVMEQYVEIDKSESSITFKHDEKGITINACIRARGVKRYGNIIF